MNTSSLRLARCWPAMSRAADHQRRSRSISPWDISSRIWRALGRSIHNPKLPLERSAHERSAHRTLERKFPGKSTARRLGDRLTLRWYSFSQTLLPPQFSHHQLNLVIRNFRRQNILQRLQPLHPHLRARRFNYRLLLLAHPCGLKLHLPRLQQIRDRTHDSRYLPASNLRKLFQSSVFAQQSQSLIRRPGHTLRFSRPLPLSKFFQRIQDRLSLHLRLTLADSGNFEKFREGFRLAAANFVQRRIVQHNVRRDILLLRDDTPPLPQILAQFLGLGARRRSANRLQRQPFLASHCGFPRRRRPHQPLRYAAAHIAGVTSLPLRSFPEVRTNLPVTAAFRLHKLADDAISLPRPVALLRVRNLIGKKSQQPGIFFLPQQNAIRTLAIAPRPSRLLVILLNRFRQRQVNHRPHRRLVDAQTKSDSANQHPHFVGHPPLLAAPPRIGSHLAVISHGGDVAIFQKIDSLLHAINRRRINNHVAARIAVQSLDQQFHLLQPFTLAHEIAQVRPVKAGDIFIGTAQLQLRQNVVPHMPRGARRESRDRTIGKLRAQPAQLPVFGTEFVPPLRDAMRLVNREKRHRHILQPADRVATRHTLRRHIQQPVSAFPRPVHYLRLLLLTQRAVEHRGRNPHL